jgi:hypothetical protein
MPKGAGEWQENEPLSASKLNANDKLNIREIRVGPGLGIQRNAGTGNASITLDEQNRPWPVVRVKITQYPEDDSTTPLIAGVTAWDGTNFVGPQFYAKVFTLAAGTNILTEPVDILVTRPFGGVPVNPQDGYDPTTLELWASPLLDPNGEPVLWVQIAAISNLFWAQFSGSTFYEVVSQTLTSGPYVGLDWVQVEGGRTGSVKNFTGTPNFLGVSYGAPPANGVCLVFQSFDVGVSPPTAVYYAVVDNHVVVKVTGNGTQQHTYTGNLVNIGPGWGNYPTTAGTGSGTSPPIFGIGQACLILNLEEFVPDVGSPGWIGTNGWKLGAGQFLFGAVASSGGAGTPPSGTPIVVVNNGLVSNGATHAMVPGSDYWNSPAGVNAAGGWSDITFPFTLLSGNVLYQFVIGVDGGGIVRAVTMTNAGTPVIADGSHAPAGGVHSITTVNGLITAIS